MTYAINDACMDELDGSCVEVFRADAILEPDQTGDDQASFDDNARFFDETLPRRERPLGDPGGAAPLGALILDTPMVTAHPKAN